MRRCGVKLWRRANVLVVWFIFILFLAGCQQHERKLSITVSGKVIYDEYTSGNIYINAFDDKYPVGIRLGGIMIVKPGDYNFTLVLPLKRVDKIYIAAVNDMGGGFKRGGVNPGGIYKENPIFIGMQSQYVYNGIDIFLEKEEVKN